jgi:hypothetical protein
MLIFNETGLWSRRIQPCDSIMVKWLLNLAASLDNPGIIPSSLFSSNLQDLPITSGFHQTFNSSDYNFNTIATKQ